MIVDQVSFSYDVQKMFLDDPLDETNASITFDIIILCSVSLFLLQ